MSESETCRTGMVPAGGARERFCRRDWAWAFGLAALCLALRGAGALRASLSADEGIVGLMALDILAGKAPTCYWYGQHYMGTLENIAAAPFIAVLGPTALAARLPSVIGAAAAVFLAYLYLVRHCGRASAAAAAVLLTISPVFFHDINIRARGGYGVTLPLAAGMLWAASTRGRPGLAGGFSFGLLAGGAFWINPQTLEISLPLAVYLLVCRRSARGLAGAALGCLAGMLAPLGHYIATGIFVRTPPAHPERALSALAGLGRRSVAVFGPGEALPPPLRAAGGAVVCLFLGAGVVFYLLSARRRGRLRALDALAATPLIAAAMLAAGGSTHAPARYYYLVYFALSILAAAGWFSLGRPLAARVAVCAALAVNAAGLAPYHSRVPFEEEYLTGGEYAEIRRVLAEGQVRHVVTDYGADFALMYLSGLAVKALPVPLGGAWYTRYEAALEPVRGAGRFAVVLYDQPPHERLKDHMKPRVFEQFLAQTGRHAVERRLARATIYMQIGSMRTAAGMEEYGRWVLGRFPLLEELLPAVSGEPSNGR